MIETGAELVELYSPAELFTAFTDAARAAAGLTEDGAAAEGGEEDGAAEPEAAGPALRSLCRGGRFVGGQPGRRPGYRRAGRRPAPVRPALSYQERSQRSEADLVERFQVAAGRFTGELGELLVVESDEERLVLQATGTFRAEVEAENEDEADDAASPGDWLVLATPEELVGFYDPTDVFGDLADALAEAFPGIAPEVTGDGSLSAKAPDAADDEPEDEPEDDASDGDADRG